MVDNADLLALRTWQHALLTLQAVAIAAAVAVPLALLVVRRRRLAAGIVGVAAVLYTVPSLALFAILAPVLGIGRTPVLVGLVAYALLVLLRQTLAGLQSVDPATLDAARGVGYGPTQVTVLVRLPAALPAVVSGLRLATVSTVALATVGVIVGYGGLGQLMFEGFTNNFYRAEISAATLACLLLAFVLDVALWATGRLLTPWARRPA
ncbi:binding-protein-dependent transport systems inner membrane component [Xylanimonas cellulosilytica DSM 15894]|uniref:Binding-protein-dependent transport systems inner membrane component n=1 Tax=Xylanimonas cellulosilytica (strain DSM 15894 / JCM 12276 / CECT 5975 / KCTC 9989 / LMG 20990 / NBRC 107835 / XIL07) TaxID=446471 RepID=D1BZF7_XYLCX|nr:binding-protein-dependent transport systems inner membrane component [Xylanimonas cellulosilytica DSM 15894]